MDCVSEYYTYETRWHEPYKEFVGTCAEIPHISFLAQTHADAMIGIRDIAKQVIIGMIEAGETLPKIKGKTMKEYYSIYELDKAIQSVLDKGDWVPAMASNLHDRYVMNCIACYVANKKGITGHTLDVLTTMKELSDKTRAYPEQCWR